MKVLREILFNPGNDDRKTFIEEFKRATFGEEVKTIQLAMDDFISNSFFRVMEVPDMALWGDVDRLDDSSTGCVALVPGASRL